MDKNSENQHSITAQEKHEITRQLKQYIVDIDASDNMTFDVLISDVKAYIHNHKILADEYQKRLKEFDEYSKSDKFRSGIDKFKKEAKEISKCRENALSKTFTDLHLFYESIGWVEFPAAKEKRPGIIELPSDVCGIFSFYYNIVALLALPSDYTGKDLFIFQRSKFHKTYEDLREKLRRLADFHIVESEDGIYRLTHLDTKINFCIHLFKVATIGVLRELSWYVKQLDARYSAVCVDMGDEFGFSTPKHRLDDTEIEILRLRKTLENPTQENIGKSLNPQLSKSHVGQKASHIKNKLGASSLDDAIRILEKDYKFNF